MKQLQLLHRKPIKAHFKLPTNNETAAQHLTAVISAEVEYRNHTFRNGDELRKQIASVAHWLCGMSDKNSLLLADGCGKMARPHLSMPCRTSSIIWASKIK
jgi:DNA replication protein DnaC